MSKSTQTSNRESWLQMWEDAIMDCSFISPTVNLSSSHPTSPTGLSETVGLWMPSKKMNVATTSTQSNQEIISKFLELC